MSTRHTSVVLDSNLLLLLTVGLWNPRAIATQKRLNGFSVDDFKVLQTFLTTFKQVVTTAHVLTEVSNLAGAASGQSREAIFTQLSLLVHTLQESTPSAVTLCEQPPFRYFGLTDAGLSHLCSEMLLLTQDGRLARHLQLRGLDAWTLEQIKHLRHEMDG